MLKWKEPKLLVGCAMYIEALIEAFVRLMTGETITGCHK